MDGHLHCQAARLLYANPRRPASRVAQNPDVKCQISARQIKLFLLASRQGESFVLQIKHSSRLGKTSNHVSWRNKALFKVVRDVCIQSSALSSSSSSSEPGFPLRVMSFVVFQYKKVKKRSTSDRSTETLAVRWLEKEASVMNLSLAASSRCFQALSAN